MWLNPSVTSLSLKRSLPWRSSQSAAGGDVMWWGKWMRSGWKWRRRLLVCSDLGAGSKLGGGGLQSSHWNDSWQQRSTKRLTAAIWLDPTSTLVCRYWPITDTPVLTYMYSSIRTNIRTVSQGQENTWNSDLKWCDYVVCPLLNI